MALTNTPNRFGSVTRALHWLTALLILTNIPLGVIANRLPYDTAEALAQKAQLFSLHKTVGVALFFVAVLRILWAITQDRPAALHHDRKAETALAGVVHWTLYLSLVAVPLSGWVHHAALAGYAPILWPFGQGLPFVPLSNEVATVAGALHWLFNKLLIGALLMHVIGALKHHLIDRDATLRRMWGGTVAPVMPVQGGHGRAPALAAVVIYVAGAGLAWSLAKPADIPDAPSPPMTQSADSTGNWAVDRGAIAFSVAQMGTGVDGSFANWQADIRFDVASRSGRVTVTIDTASLSLGSVTNQAREAEFFDVSAHPTAVFDAAIAPAPDSADPSAHVASGTLTLRGMTLPLDLPFTLTLDGDRAHVSGAVEIDRRSYQMGLSYPDAASVGFMVGVVVDVTATRKP